MKKGILLIVSVILLVGVFCGSNEPKLQIKKPEVYEKLTINMDSMFHNISWVLVESKSVGSFKDYFSKDSIMKKTHYSYDNKKDSLLVDYFQVSNRLHTTIFKATIYSNLDSVFVRSVYKFQHSHFSEKGFYLFLIKIEFYSKNSMKVTERFEGITRRFWFRRENKNLPWVLQS